ncbi:MAG TPA: ATPase [Erysipelotrichaceae bacterium]|nr:ATP synthase subunit C [Erysipelotrichaceae bacterium]HCV54680.1 ATPase [Erysipelotrichaceae bacterium]HCW55192.1 ATPase [Erysipelotrichaceae bacterium]
MLTLKEMILPLIAVVLIVGPIALIFSGKVSAKNARAKMIAQISIFAGVFAVMMIFQLHQFTVFAEDGAVVDTSKSMGFLAAALAVAASSLGAAWAVAKAAPAALGAISENPDNFGKAIIFVALGEGIAIYGLLISILILNNL